MPGVERGLSKNIVQSFRVVAKGLLFKRNYSPYGNISDLISPRVVDTDTDL